ncbi:MAG TPA: hypothetical protein DIU09_12175 [Hyphomonadaceae bacterium]|nr:hypothetical protein [Hyphomonadaceae bacterium]
MSNKNSAVNLGLGPAERSGANDRPKPALNRLATCLRKDMARAACSWCRISLLIQPIDWVNLITSAFHKWRIITLSLSL